MSLHAGDELKGRGDAAARLATWQGAYFLVSGVWPLISLRSFEAVTGRKDEPWLVKSMGVVLAAIGCALLRARRDPGRALVSLGRAPALGLAGVDLWYAGVRRCISPVYLADAALEVGFVVGWTLLERRARTPAAVDDVTPGALS